MKAIGKMQGIPGHEIILCYQDTLDKIELDKLVVTESHEMPLEMKSEATAEVLHHEGHWKDAGDLHQRYQGYDLHCESLSKNGLPSGCFFSGLCRTLLNMRIRIEAQEDGRRYMNKPSYVALISIQWHWCL